MASLTDVHAGVGRYIPRPGEAYYRLEGASVVLDQVCRSLVKVVDERGVPLAGVDVTNYWPGGSATRPTGADGVTEFFFGPEAKFWPPNQGPHSVVVARDANGGASDVVYGMGLPEGRHADYQLLFVRKTAYDVPPPEEPPANDEYIELGHVDIGRLRLTASWRK